jgi:hypothetical protein
MRPLEVALRAQHQQALLRLRLQLLLLEAALLQEVPLSRVVSIWPSVLRGTTQSSKLNTLPLFKSFALVITTCVFSWRLASNQSLTFENLAASLMLCTDEY